MIFRNPAFAGKFYDFSKEQLFQSVLSFINKNTAEKKDVIGAVVPHAGYIYSGSVAGKTISKIEKGDTFIIIGPNHTGIGKDFSIVNGGIWRTPLGEIKIDNLLTKEILKKSKSLSIDPSSHENEHSIEVQLPFIQVLFPTARFIPITIRHYIPEENFLLICRRIGESIANAIKKVNEKVVIVASSDLTHYEEKSIANKKDKIALNKILDLDPQGLFKEISEKNISMCGFGPVAIMLFAGRKLGAKKAELVSYKTSGDVTKDNSQVVGYGGVVVW